MRPKAAKYRKEQQNAAKTSKMRPRAANAAKAGAGVKQLKGTSKDWTELGKSSVKKINI